MADAASGPFGIALAAGGAVIACLGFAAWRVARRRGLVVEGAVDAIKRG
jgi:hypothetical protein